MNPIFKLNVLWKLQHYLQPFARKLLLCCFLVCLTVTASLIVTNSNSTYAKDIALLSIYDDHSTQGMVNLDDIYADAINIDNQYAVDLTLVKARMKYEQKLADLTFVLQQFEMMELQTFKFVIEIYEHEQATSIMLMHLQKMLTEFTALNPDIQADWKIDPNNAFKLIVELDTERQQQWARAGFII